MLLKERLLAILLLFPLYIFADNTEYGLSINTYPQEEAITSSLILENNQPIRLSRTNTLSFEMYIRRENSFGTIFRIITDNNDNIDLIFTDDNDVRYPLLAIKDNIYPISKELEYYTWIPVSITLSSKENKISLLYGEEEKTVSYPVSHNNNMKVSFGKCPFEGFMLPDVASIDIRNVKLEENNKTTRFWKLEKHAQELCYDSIGNVPAIALHPNWIIDRQVRWNKIYHKSYPKSMQIAYNEGKDEFYLVTDTTKVFIFNPAQKEECEIAVREGRLASMAVNRLLYDAERNQLITYNIEENIISLFSFDTQKWSNDKKSGKEQCYWNNTSTFFPSDRYIVTFGGYGLYKYTNELTKIWLDRKKEEKIIVGEIDPRYTCASVIVGNQLYIFGGRGCKSGRQELFQRNYYDLYSIDLKGNQVRKVWGTDRVEEDFLPGEHMVYDKENECFYLFISKRGGILLKLDPQKEDFEEMSLPIGENLEAYTLYTNLHYSKANNRLYAVINNIRADDTSEIRIYTMQLPAVSLAELSQPIPHQEKTTSGSFLPIIGSILGVILVSIIIIFLLKNSKKPVTENKKEKSVPTIIKENTETFPVKEKKYYDFSRQSICLLGEFNVRDKEGQDITASFTPILKYLFVLLILFSQKNEKGISGNKLIQLLWPDKNKESAKNNRNVYMSKLRTILEKVGNIEIFYKNDYWSISMGENVKCDYMETMTYFNQLVEGTLKEEDLDKLLELLLRGILLPNTETDWVDNFKSEFSNLTIDTFSDILKTRSECPDHLKIKIADTILLHDYINEEALHIKCSILYHSGKKGVAKNIYDNFCKEYYNLLETKYKRSFADIVKGE